MCTHQEVSLRNCLAFLSTNLSYERPVENVQGDGDASMADVTEIVTTDVQSDLSGSERIKNFLPSAIVILL